MVKRVHRWIFESTLQLIVLSKAEKNRLLVRDNESQFFNLYTLEVAKTGCSYIYSVKDMQRGQKKKLD